MVEQTDQAAVQARAYQLWEESGRADGNHEEHWRRAEAECSAGTTSSEADDSVDEAVASDIDGEVPGQLHEPKRKLRRWPTPIIDK